MKKKIDKKDLFKCIGIVLIGLALCVGSIIGIKTIFEKTNKEDSSFILEKIENNGIRLRKDKYVVEPNYDSVTITAEVDSSSSDTKLNWSLEWGNKYPQIDFYYNTQNSFNLVENKFYGKSLDCVLNCSNDDNTQFSKGYLVFYLPAYSSIEINSRPEYANYKIIDQYSVSTDPITKDKYIYTNPYNTGIYIRMYSLSEDNYLNYIRFDFSKYCESVELEDLIVLTVSEDTFSCNIKSNGFQCPINLVCSSRANPKVNAKTKMDMVGRTLAPLFDLDLSAYSINDLKLSDIKNEIDKYSVNNYILVGGTLMSKPSNVSIESEIAFPCNIDYPSFSCTDNLNSDRLFVDFLLGDIGSDQCCYNSMEEAIEILLEYKVFSVDMYSDLSVVTYEDDESSNSEYLFKTSNWVNFQVIWGNMDYVQPTSILLSDHEVIF